MSQELQSNTREGRLIKSSVANLSGYDGFAVVLVNNGGYGSVGLPTAQNQKPFGIISDGSITQAEVMQQQGLDWGPQGSYGVGVWPLDPSKNMRVYLLGTCNPGDVLVLALPSAAAAINFPLNFPTPSTTLTITVAAGLAQSVAGLGSGTFGVLGQAEEAGVQGQLVLFRPWPGQTITQ